MNTAALQKQLYGVAIFEDEIVLADFSDNAERRYVVTPEQLMGFFKTEITFRPFPGLIWMKTDGVGDTFMITLPAAQRTILYKRGGKGKKKIEAIPLRLPTIAVKASFSGTDRKLSSIGMWGFAGRTLRDDTVLYELPLPNLSGSSLCLGATERASGCNISATVERVIFDTPFNHHSHLVGTAKLPFHDYAKKYRGSCPLRTLNKLGYGRQLLGGKL
jgi:hypothetical protein